MMRYWKVKAYRDFSDGTVLVKNELVTGREFAKARYDRFPRDWFEEVEVSPRKTYWFFGARFRFGERPT